MTDRKRGLVPGMVRESAPTSEPLKASVSFTCMVSFVSMLFSDLLRIEKY